MLTLKLRTGNPHLLPFACLLDLLIYLAYLIPDRISGPEYFEAVHTTIESWSKTLSYDSRKVELAVCVLLQSTNTLSTSNVVARSGSDKSPMSVYSGFAWNFLAASVDDTCIDIDTLSGSLDYRLLTQAIKAGIPKLSKIASHVQGRSFRRMSPLSSWRHETSIEDEISNIHVP